MTDDGIWSEDDPTEDGLYVVWVSADEGEGYGWSTWTDPDRWQNGAWKTYGGSLHVFKRSVKSFSELRGAEAFASDAYASQ